MTRCWKLVVLVLTIPLGCAPSSQLEFAAWKFPVPDGVPVKEYAPVPMDSREGKTIELIEDLVIGGDEPSRFLGVPDIAVGDDGTIYVLDNGNDRIQVFGPDGEFRYSRESETNEPPSLRLRRITIAGDELLVADMRKDQISAWTLTGAHIGKRQSRTPITTSFEGLADGSYLDGLIEELEDGSQRRLAVRFSTFGTEIERFLEAAGRPPLSADDEAIGLQRLIDGWRYDQFRFAAAANQFYVALLDEYQVLALNNDGDPQWALRVAWAAPPYSEAERNSYSAAPRRKASTLRH